MYLRTAKQVDVISQRRQNMLTVSSHFTKSFTFVVAACKGNQKTIYPVPYTVLILFRDLNL